MERPTLTPDRAMQQAGMTAHSYLINAIHDINKSFGEDYAESHPELIAAYMHAAALDYQATCQLDGFYEVAAAIREVAESQDRTTDALDGLGADIEELAKIHDKIPAALQRLGLADAVTPMGAIEMLAMEVKGAAESLSGISENLAEINISRTPSE